MGFGVLGFEGLRDWRVLSGWRFPAKTFKPRMQGLEPRRPQGGARGSAVGAWSVGFRREKGGGGWCQASVGLYKT